MKTTEIDIEQVLDALEDLVNSLSGFPKKCGHEFSCSCPLDKAKEILTNKNHE